MLHAQPKHQTRVVHSLLWPDATGIGNTAMQNMHHAQAITIQCEDTLQLDIFYKSDRKSDAIPGGSVWEDMLLEEDEPSVSYGRM